MRSYTLVGLVALVAGCSDSGSWSSGGANPGEPATPAIGQVRQKAQFADDTIINLVDPDTATLTVTADVNPVDIQIFYVGDKTTDAGQTPSAAVLVDTISLAGDETKVHQVNLSHPAFQGGYGSLLLDSLGNTTLDVFQTYVQYGGSMFSVGGSVFTGGSYRIPYRTGTIRMVLALTNQSDFSFDIDLANLGGAGTKTITLAPLSTYKFDSQAQGWSLSGTSSVQIFTNAGGTVALSGYIDRAGAHGHGHHNDERIRITPVKAAPFP